MEKFKTLKTYTTFSKNVQIVVISELVLAAAFGIYGFLQILYLNSINIPANKIGFIFSVGSLSSMVAFFIGPFIHMFGRKNILLLGCLLSVIGISFYIFSASYVILLIAQIFINIGLCFIQVTELQLLYSYTTPDKECCAYSYKSSVNFIASMIGGLVAGNINRIYFFRNITYKHLFITAVAMNFIAFLIRLFLLPKEDKVKVKLDEAKESIKAARKLLKNHETIRVFALFLFIISIGGSAVFPFINLILKNHYNLSDTSISLVSALITSLNMIGIISMPVVIEKIGIKKFEIGTLISLAISTFCLSLGFPTIVFIGILILRCASACLVGSSLDTSMMSHIELEHRDIFAGVKLLVNGIACAIGQFIGGFIIEKISYRVTYIYSLIILVVVIIMFYKKVNKYFINKEQLLISKINKACKCHLRHQYIERK